jgi:hypothetical protein
MLDGLRIVPARDGRPVGCDGAHSFSQKETGRY